MKPGEGGYIALRYVACLRIAEPARRPARKQKNLSCRATVISTAEVIPSVPQNPGHLVDGTEVDGGKRATRW